MKLEGYQALLIWAQRQHCVIVCLGDEKLKHNDNFSVTTLQLTCQLISPHLAYLDSLASAHAV